MYDLGPNWTVMVLVGIFAVAIYAAYQIGLETGTRRSEAEQRQAIIKVKKTIIAEMAKRLGVPKDMMLHTNKDNFGNMQDLQKRMDERKQDK